MLPMAINIGFFCKDAVIVASDSQIAWPGGSKSLDPRKVVKVEFRNTSMLIGKSGIRNVRSVNEDADGL